MAMIEGRREGERGLAGRRAGTRQINGKEANMDVDNSLLLATAEGRGGLDKAALGYLNGRDGEPSWARN
jgi:hypothetical protein